MRKLYPVGSMEIRVFFLGMHKFLWLGLAIIFVLSLSLGGPRVGDLSGMYRFYRLYRI
jgi:hypothetical protein